MKQVKIFCDHCGKELDEKHDYDGIKIDLWYANMVVDLCDSCMKEL